MCCGGRVEWGDEGVWAGSRRSPCLGVDTSASGDRLKSVPGDQRK